MMSRNESADVDGDEHEAGSVSVFSPARALESVGDRWSLLIFREVMFGGVSGFEDLRRRLDLPEDILSARLDGMVGAGLLTDTGTPAGMPSFALTAQGENLEHVIIALTAWSDGWISPGGPPIEPGGPAPGHPPLHSGDRPAAGAPPATRITLSVLGSFALHVGDTPVESLSVGSQRLLVFLALHDRSISRSSLAGQMWPDVSEENAGISLRSALSRVDVKSRTAILSASAGLSLADTVDVDFRIAETLARRLLDPGIPTVPDDLGAAATALLSAELLPDWYDEWVLDRAEDWRQLRVAALEIQSTKLLAMGRLPEAIGAARAAVKVDPLRESATTGLVAVHLAAGNRSEALRIYDQYVDLLRASLGIGPSAVLTALVAPLRAPTGSTPGGPPGSA